MLCTEVRTDDIILSRSSPKQPKGSISAIVKKNGEGLMTRRITSLVLAVVVLVGCLVLHDRNSGAARVGAGGGVDERIEDVEDLGLLLEFISDMDRSASTGAYSLLAHSSDDDEPEYEDLYESATVHISTELTAESSSSNSEYTGGVRSTSQSVNRKLSIYITEDATYYVSRGVYSLNQMAKSGMRNRVINFDMEVAVIDDDEVYIMFHDFLYIEDNESRRIKPAMKDIWIEIDHGIASSFITIDTQNRSVLSSMKEMLYYFDEYDMIEDERGLTTLTTEDFEELGEELGEEPIADGTDIKFTLDMSVPQNPNISSVAVIDSEDVREITTGYTDYFQPITEEVRVTNKSSVVQEISICNVNNTVVDMDTSGDFVTIDEDDDEDVLFIIKVVDDKEDEEDE